jgi:leucyl aminopeptidase
MSDLVFTAKSGAPEAQKTSCLVVAMNKAKSLPAALSNLDGALGGALTRVLKNKDFSGDEKQCMSLAPTDAFPRVILLGLGESPLRAPKARQAIATLWGAASKTQAKDLVIDLSAANIDADCDVAEIIGQEITTGTYSYTRTLSKPKASSTIKKVILLASNKNEVGLAKAALASGQAIGQGINYARELANLPGNICTPSYLADQAAELANTFPTISCESLGEAEMRQLGMHSLLSVSAGSDQEAKLIIMQYKGDSASDAQHCLVGKGITFDTGGISLKPGAKMDEMKFDMGGAASVFGTMQTLAKLEAKINVVGIVAAAENMPSGSATKPGDVVTSMAGLTIEILNTDAEGRLVLCDALTYAERFNPVSVVDIATLTGACVVALGHHATGLYANNDELAAELLTAGEQTGDRAWRMPLWDEYQSQLDSPFADLGNIGGPAAGSVTAACFLSRFTKAYSWAHLDIAGSAWNSAPKGATGRPVALLTKYLNNQS